MHALMRCMLLFCLVVVSGCNQDALIAKFTPHPEAEIGRQAIDDWRTGHMDRVKPLLAGQVADLADTLAAEASQMPSVAPISVKVIKASTSFGSGLTRYDLAYEYTFEGRWMIADVVIFKDGDHREIVGMHARMEDQSLEQSNAFTLAGKGAVHYLVLLLTIASPLVCLTAFVLCLRTPMRRYKVWWALFALVGIVTLHFNWTTGAANLNLVSFQLFGASESGELYSPLILGVSIPVGAIWFLIQRKALTVRRRDIRRPSELPQ